MGVSNHGQYILTKHAIERYSERIDHSKSETQMLKDVRNMMSRSRLLGKTQENNEAWLCEKRSIVIIVDTSTRKVITIYSSLDEYKEANVKSLDLHPKVEQIISVASKEAYKKQERYYFSKLEPMYKEYSDRIGKLSRTSNQEVFEDKKIELNDLQRDITQVVSEKNRVLNDLKEFITS